MKNRTQSDELFERARKVVPGGIYGHVRRRPGCQTFSSFLRPCPRFPFRGRDGTNVDFMCGRGDFHGYNHPEMKKPSLNGKKDLFSISLVHLWSSWPRLLLLRLILPSRPSLPRMVRILLHGRYGCPRSTEAHL